MKRLGLGRAAIAVLLGILGTSRGVASSSSCEDPRFLQEAATRYFHENRIQLLREFAQLLAMPNHASQPADIARNAQYLQPLLAARGIKSSIASVDGIPVALIGERRVRGAKRTLMLYAHFDGQPAPPEGWATPPFQPTLKDGERIVQFDDPAVRAAPVANVEQMRIYARSASDDKAGVFAILEALDVLSSSHCAPAVNLRIYFDGEEEVGSPNLRRILRENRDLLRSDAGIFIDGPVHASGRPQIVLGVRGSQGLDITLFGPAHPVHSGHYGNWAVNPAARLAAMLSSMRDTSGRILIRDFSRSVVATRPLTDEERKPYVEAQEQLQKELRLSGPENPQWDLADAVALPAMNIVEFHAGPPLGTPGSNSIPAEAMAHIDFRLVAGQSAVEVKDLVERHMASAGYRIATERAQVEQATDRDRVVLLNWGDMAYGGVRYDAENPRVQSVISVLRAVYKENLLVTPYVGGSLPISIFGEESIVPALLIIPMANHDNNQHGPNENIKIANLRYGIEMLTGVIGTVHLPPATKREGK